MKKAEIKKILEADSNINYDKVIFHKDGTVELRFDFFYTHGITSKKYADEILAKIPEAKIVSHRECRNAKGKDSYFQVVFSVNP